MYILHSVFQNSSKEITIKGEEIDTLITKIKSSWENNADIREIATEERLT